MVALYENYNLVANPINRYSIGNRTPCLKKDPDGGLTIYIQHESPGADKESNWLPAPKRKYVCSHAELHTGTAYDRPDLGAPGITPAKA